MGKIVKVAFPIYWFLMPTQKIELLDGCLSQMSWAGLGQLTQLSEAREGQQILLTGT